MAEPQTTRSETLERRSKMTNWTLLLVSLMALLLSACDTGFGQPCSIPETATFRQACVEGVESTEDMDENSIQMSSTASCAIRNFAGCSTRICMVYKGSDPICSMECRKDADCDGSALCRPLIGDTTTYIDDETCNPERGGSSECFCVRKGDVTGG